MSSKQLQHKSFVQTIVPLAKTSQFYWYIGHVLSVVSFAGQMLYSLFSAPKALRYYRYTLLFELISYGIVIKQVHFKTKAPSRNQVLKDENVQYFLLALILWVTSFKIGAVAGALYSFVIFSFFHSVAYFQSNILSSLPISISAQDTINSRISFITSNYNQQALFLAASAETMIITTFLWGAPFLIFKLFKDPIFVIVDLYAFVAVVVFVKLRYNDSQHTLNVVNQFDYKISTTLSNPMLPPAIGAFYNVSFKGFVQKWIGPIRVPSPAAKTNKKVE